MKIFEQRELKEAFDYADEGGQALHLQKPFPYPGAPKCFQEADQWGHLIDNDIERLKRTAKQFGVNRIVVSRKGRRGQHVDLCGAPLVKAIAKAKGMTT